MFSESVTPLKSENKRETKRDRSYISKGDTPGFGEEEKHRNTSDLGVGFAKDKKHKS